MSKIRICPNQDSWKALHEKLETWAADHDCEPMMPPTPLAGNAWSFSNDDEKKARWEETVKWATDNGCPELVSSIGDDQYYSGGA